MAHSKAFTVQELLVAMVISSLIIGMVYGIYVQLNKHLYTYSRSQEEMIVFNQFKQILAYDLFWSTAIEKNAENGFTIKFREGEHDYLFLPDKVIRDRKNVAKDTFDLTFPGFTLKKNNNYLSITLSTILDGGDLTIFEAKEISIANRINSICGE